MSNRRLPEGFCLTARGLSLEAGGHQILQGVNLALRAGELVALLGPSGSGKSTLLRALNGFRPAQGRVSVNGQDLYASFEDLKTQIGFVPQDDVLHSALVVQSALRYAARLRLPEADSERIDHEVRTVLSQVGLSDRANVRIRNLSGGQRKRVSVAMELLSRPPLMFLDEPTSGLDPALEHQMMTLFRSLTTQARLTVVTTHVLASLQAVDLVVVLAGGRLVFIGEPAEVPEFFEVGDLPAVYRALSSTDPRRWARKLESSLTYRRWVLDRMQGPV